MLFCMTPEQITEAFLGEVAAEMGRQRISAVRLAVMVDLDPSALSRKLRGKTELKFSESLAICEALHVTIPTLLDRIAREAVA